MARTVEGGSFFSGVSAFFERVLPAYPDYGPPRDVYVPPLDRSFIGVVGSESIRGPITPQQVQQAWASQTILDIHGMDALGAVHVYATGITFEHAPAAVLTCLAGHLSKRGANQDNDVCWPDTDGQIKSAASALRVLVDNEEVQKLMREKDVAALRSYMQELDPTYEPPNNPPK